MTHSTALHSIRRANRTHGSRFALYDLAIRALNKVIYYRNFQCVVIERVIERCIALQPAFRFLKLSQAQLLEFAQNDICEMTADFVRASLAKGDECYGILDGDTLASYGWYSRQPTVLDNRDLVLRFNSDYVYMYKGFTTAAYRGKRLHAIGMTRALVEYQAQGFKGLVSYVESNNFDSLRSCYRMGYQNCGQIRVIRLAGKYLMRAPSICQQYGLAIDLCARE